MDGGNAKGLLAAPAHPCARGISASLHVRTIPALHIALPLGLGCFAPYAEPSADRGEARREAVREGSRTSAPGTGMAPARTH